jgi:hypothetical protein
MANGQSHVINSFQIHQVNFCEPGGRATFDGTIGFRPGISLAEG